MWENFENANNWAILQDAGKGIFTKNTLLKYSQKINFNFWSSHRKYLLFNIDKYILFEQLPHIRNIYEYCIFQPAFGCCARQTLDEIVIFSNFVLKSWKMQKSSKFGVKLSKKTSFWISTQTLVECCFLSEKAIFGE